MFEAAFFDGDGVLFETEGWKYEGWNRVLQPYGASLDEATYYRMFAGHNGLRNAAELVRMYGLDIASDSLLLERHELVNEWMRTRDIPLCAYAAQGVARMREQMPVALITGAEREEVEIKLSKTPFVFDAIVTQDEVVNAKPHPESYLEGARLLQANPVNCVGFEDTLPGIMAIQRARMTAVGVKSAHDLYDVTSADVTVDSLRAGIDWALSDEK